MSWGLTQMAIFALLISPALAVGAHEDAATLYRQAIEKLPRDDADREMYARWQSGAPMHQIAAETLGGCEQSLRLLHDAAASESCNWGWSGRQAQSARSDELQSIEFLAEAAALETRVLFEQKRQKEAAALFGDVLVLGQRVADCDIPDARRCGFRVQHIAFVVTARYLPGLPHDVLDGLARAAGSLADQPVALRDADDATALAQKVNRAERALFAAAVAVARNGRGALVQTRDPFGDGAFGYDVQVDGFLLRSRLAAGGAPVTLKCGPQAFE